MKIIINGTRRWIMTLLQDNLNKFIEDFESTVVNQKYYSAMALGLALPDICSKLQYPDETSTGKRYIDWYDQYMKSKYQSILGTDTELTTFLTGNDFYALRCSFLHHGETDISDQRAREVLNNFTFVKPQLGSVVHLNKVNDKLQLQVDIFCIDIFFGVKKWLEDHKDNVEMNKKAESLFEIKETFDF